MVVAMAHVTRSIRDQLLQQGVVKPEDTQEAKRASLVKARPPEPDKELPPLFEAPARGVIVQSSGKKTDRR